MGREDLGKGAIDKPDSTFCSWCGPPSGWQPAAPSAASLGGSSGADSILLTCYGLLTSCLGSEQVVGQLHLLGECSFLGSEHTMWFTQQRLSRRNTSARGSKFEY